MAELLLVDSGSMTLLLADKAFAVVSLLVSSKLLFCLLHRRLLKLAPKYIDPRSVLVLNN